MRLAGMAGGHAGGFEVESPEAGGCGFGDVDRLAVGREANAVWGIEPVANLGDRGAVGLGVVQPAPVAVAGAAFAEIGEVESTGGVEHNVVRTA